MSSHNQPSAARIYDYDLGGSRNTRADRDASHRIREEIAPNGPFVARANRAFLGRAVRYCVNKGIGQFLDLGSGIPTVGNVHEIAQRLNPAARTVYVDNEPVAVSDTKRLLADEPNADIVGEDLRNPDAVLSAEPTRRLLDFDQPIGLLMVAALHYVDPEADPERVLRTYTDALPSGSCLVFSQITADNREEEAQRVIDWFAENTATPVTMRSKAEITELLTTCGWELIEPGLVYPPHWNPDPADPNELPAERSATWAGVARLDR
ncbi:SAM-dependent methyltransferase [Saccharopolyspora sp. 6T]|uniref:SAM-dependent methyltransferase n=1 Tax=Saccharopolyspora sp. 6T TaxID=2877238 RepID=UPI001CD2EF00|nr:SAM-dependent methyltransferase [Saccharopolyspora sp. 6T]MCA1185724.1 SAM-dependent methyltransferase [Saccharopolyspora sp. 6T]